VTRASTNWLWISFMNLCRRFKKISETFMGKLHRVFYATLCIFQNGIPENP
jgi:hypothetical protein